jgi:hypothetical protein
MEDPDSPQNTTLLMLGVALARFGFKEMLRSKRLRAGTVERRLGTVRFQIGALLA